MEFEVRNIQEHKEAHGHHYTCDVYVDGKFIVTAIEHGSLRPIQYTNGSESLFKSLVAQLNPYPPHVWTGGMLGPDPQWAGDFLKRNPSRLELDADLLVRNLYLIHQDTEIAEDFNALDGIIRLPERTQCHI